MRGFIYMRIFTFRLNHHRGNTIDVIDMMRYWILFALGGNGFHIAPEGTHIRVYLGWKIGFAIIDLLQSLDTDYKAENICFFMFVRKVIGRMVWWLNRLLCYLLCCSLLS